MSIQNFFGYYIECRCTFENIKYIFDYFKHMFEENIINDIETKLFDNTELTGLQLIHEIYNTNLRVIRNSSNLVYYNCLTIWPTIRRNITIDESSHYFSEHSIGVVVGYHLSMKNSIIQINDYILKLKSAIKHNSKCNQMCKQPFKFKNDTKLMIITTDEFTDRYRFKDAELVYNKSLFSGELEKNIIYVVQSKQDDCGCEFVELIQSRSQSPNLPINSIEYSISTKQQIEKYVSLCEFAYAHDKIKEVFLEGEISTYARDIDDVTEEPTFGLTNPNFMEDLIDKRRKNDMYVMIDNDDNHIYRIVNKVKTFQKLVKEHMINEYSDCMKFTEMECNGDWDDPVTVVGDKKPVELSLVMSTIIDEKEYVVFSSFSEYSYVTFDFE